MNKKIALFSALFAVLGISTLLISSEQREWAIHWRNVQLADISFVNKTGHDIKIKANQAGVDRAPIVVGKDKNSQDKAITLQNQNLDKITSYTIEFAHGWRPYYGMIGYTTELTINTQELGILLTQNQQSTMTIIIHPTTFSGYVTGFGKPEYSIRPTTAKKPTEFALEESFIVLEQDPETDILLQHLRLSPQAESYELFGMGAFPTADRSKSFNEQSEPVIKYAKTLEERRAAMLKKYPDNIALDIKIEKQYHIKDFSRKMRHFIESAYQDIIHRMGL